MAKVARKSGSRAERVRRAVPWRELAQGGIAVGSRWQRLSRKDRERLIRLLRESRGRVMALSEKERRELRKLLAKLDLAGLGRELGGLARRYRRRRGRRHR